MVSEASDDGTRQRLRLRKLFAALGRLRRSRERIEDLLQSFGRKDYYVKVRPYTLDIDNLDALFDSELLELPQTRKRMALNSSGETIKAPYAFYERLVVERLPVFEPNIANIQRHMQERGQSLPDDDAAPAGDAEDGDVYGNAGGLGHGRRGGEGR